MTLDEGTFQLYNRIDAPLDAGNWKLRLDQELTASLDGRELDDTDLRVATGEAHFTVRSPRFVLPPDQVLSTFPPANSEGSYGSRLPQVVIKRRTLPWERSVGDAGEEVTDPPWLALVLIAEGEAEFVANAPTGDCFTPGLALSNGDAEPAEVPVGNHLRIRQSMVHRIFPTQQDVELLAHARAVDINDTELMMGDDDGYLSVVISNRLPMSGRDPDGEVVPVRYLACLVNLEGQYTRLLRRSPDPIDVTAPITVTHQAYEYLARADHARMGTVITGTVAPGVLAADTDATDTVDVDAVTMVAGATAVVTDFPLADAVTTAGSAQLDEWNLADTGSTAAETVYERMAKPWSFESRFGNVIDAAELIDPTLRFPVLLHWSFTSYGDKTFKSLMKGLSSGLVGSVDADRPAPDGRLPLDVVETGHVGLPHRTREGDVTTSWYRGPLLPHPPPPVTADNRLPLAHSSDQLRVVVPDRREDVSLATGFEIGRLLALSRPSIVAALMRWRADRFAVARRRNLLDKINAWVEAGTGRAIEVDPDVLLDTDFGYDVVFELMRQATGKPEVVFGQPLPLHRPGRPLELDREPAEILQVGLGIDENLVNVDGAGLVEILARQKTPQSTFTLSDLDTAVIRDVLHRSLDERVLDLTAEVNGVDRLDVRLRRPGEPGRDGPGRGGPR